MDSYKYETLKSLCATLQEQIKGYQTGTDTAREAIKHTQDRMQQLRSLIAALPADERQGRFLRIVELAEIVHQGIDAIETELYKDIPEL